MSPNAFLELARGQNDILPQRCILKEQTGSFCYCQVLLWSGGSNGGGEPSPVDLVNTSSKYNLLQQTGEPREMKETTLKT